MSVSVAGKQLSQDKYERTDKKLILKGLPSGDFKVDIEVKIKPQVGIALFPGSQLLH